MFTQRQLYTEQSPHASVVISCVQIHEMFIEQGNEIEGSKRTALIHSYEVTQSGNREDGRI
jgi:hypothetical protein